MARIQGSDAVWDLLAVCGAPIMAMSKRRSSVRPTKRSLIKALKDSCKILLKDNGTAAMTREGQAVQALLLALKTHFPTFYRTHVSRSKLVSSFTPGSSFDPKLLKLRRIAIARLAKYL